MRFCNRKSQCSFDPISFFTDACLWSNPPMRYHYRNRRDIAIVIDAISLSQASAIVNPRFTENLCFIINSPFTANLPFCRNSLLYRNSPFFVKLCFIIKSLLIASLLISQSPHFTITHRNHLSPRPLSSPMRYRYRIIVHRYIMSLGHPRCDIAYR